MGGGGAGCRPVRRSLFWWRTGLGGALPWRPRRGSGRGRCRPPWRRHGRGGTRRRRCAGSGSLRWRRRAGCVFALGGARAGGFLGILAVSIDLGLAGCARFIRIIPYAYWRAREARSFPLPYYWGGFGGSGGVLRPWVKKWGRRFLSGGDREAARPVSRQNAKARQARQESKRRSWSFIQGALCIKMVLMQIHTTLRILALALLLACHPHSGKCEAMLPGILSSHMVLQRERPIHIWGWSAPGEKVSVAFDGISRDVVGNSLGNWSVFLPPEAAGGPYQLIVTGSNQIVLD